MEMYLTHSLRKAAEITFQNAIYPGGHLWHDA